MFIIQPMNVYVEIIQTFDLCIYFILGLIIILKLLPFSAVYEITEI